MKGFTRIGGTVAVLVAVTASGASAAKLTSVNTSRRVTPGPTYVALGDSVTFGFDEQTVTPPPDYRNASSFIAYPQLVGQALKLKVVNAACPGETSASLISASSPSNGCENSPSPTRAAYRAKYPLHVKYNGSQLAFAVSYLKTHANVRLVSLMIGANDAFLCQETTKDGCKAELPSVLAKLKRNVATILSAIRHKAHYSGQILIVNYYALNYGIPAIAAQSRLLNGAVDGPARSFKVGFADGFGVLRTAAVHSGGDSCRAGLLTQTGGDSCGVHPSVAGQALLAQAVEDVTTP